MQIVMDSDLWRHGLTEEEKVYKKIEWKEMFSYIWILSYNIIPDMPLNKNLWDVQNVVFKCFWIWETYF